MISIKKKEVPSNTPSTTSTSTTLSCGPKDLRDKTYEGKTDWSMCVFVFCFSPTATTTPFFRLFDFFFLGSSSSISCFADTKNNSESTPLSRMNRILLLLGIVGPWACALQAPAVSGTFSLRPTRRGRLAQSLPESAISETSSSTEHDAEEEESDSKSILQFRALINSESSPLEYSSKDEVEAFFTCPNNRNMFITAGGKREYEQVAITSEILTEWEQICQQEGMAIPKATDEAFAVKTGGIKFPGLTLETRATMGIKLVGKESGPTYEVTLIGDDRKVKGLPPVVYLFNRLTGGGSDNGSSQNLSTTQIVCEFDNDTSTVVFKTTTRFIINIRFPSILMKIIPTSKEKAEAQGSQAITKAVGKDIQDSMVVFEEAYLASFATEQSGSM